MTETLTLEALARTCEAQAAELALLRERVEDLEDLNDLNQAIARNAGRPMIPWEQVRRELPDLTDEDFAEEARRSSSNG